MESSEKAVIRLGRATSQNYSVCNCCHQPLKGPMKAPRSSARAQKAFSGAPMCSSENALAGNYPMPSRARPPKTPPKCPCERPPETPLRARP